MHQISYPLSVCWHIKIPKKWSLGNRNIRNGLKTLTTLTLPESFKEGPSFPLFGHWESKKRTRRNVGLFSIFSKGKGPRNLRLPSFMHHVQLHMLSWLVMT